MNIAKAGFVIVPAILVGSLLAMIEPGFGLICGGGMIWLGLEVTQARPERDEV